MKLANNVTWTMSSIYLVGSLLALNGSLTQQVIDTPWRPRVGLAVVILSVIWLMFDVVYFFSARSARSWLAATEARWEAPARFFYGQHHSAAASERSDPTRSASSAPGATSSYPPLE